MHQTSNNKKKHESFNEFTQSFLLASWPSYCFFWSNLSIFFILDLILNISGSSLIFYILFYKFLIIKVLNHIINEINKRITGLVMEINFYFYILRDSHFPPYQRVRCSQDHWHTADVFSPVNLKQCPMPIWHSPSEHA